MPARNIAYLSSVLILPALFVLFYAIRVLTDGNALSQTKWFTLAIIGTMIILERLYKYRYAVSQRSVLVRDISSTLVNLYVTGAVAGLIFLPVLAFFPEFFFGRNLFFAFSEQLGPFWLQVPVTMLLVSFFRYWMHRLQHKVPFLWELHSYHHGVTDLKASNLLVSHWMHRLRNLRNVPEVLPAERQRGTAVYYGRTTNPIESSWA